MDAAGTDADSLAESRRPAQGPGASPPGAGVPGPSRTQAVRSVVTPEDLSGLTLEERGRLNVALAVDPPRVIAHVAYLGAECREFVGGAGDADDRVLGALWLYRVAAFRGHPGAAIALEAWAEALDAGHPDRRGSSAGSWALPEDAPDGLVWLDALIRKRPAAIGYALFQIGQASARAGDKTARRWQSLAVTFGVNAWGLDTGYGFGVQPGGSRRGRDAPVDEGLGDL